jgi:hypothetical protein
MPQNRTMYPTASAPVRPPSPQDSITDSTVSLAKVTTIPRCRDSITSQLARDFLSIENPNTAADEAKMTSFFEPISTGNISPVPYGDIETRKNSCRLPLEAVPEMNELDVVNSRYSFDPSLLHNSHHLHAVQPSPVLITFDSSSLKRRT